MNGSSIQTYADILFLHTVFFSLVPVKLNSIKGTDSRSKMLVLLVWSIHKFELRFFSKETMKKRKETLSKSPLNEE